METVSKPVVADIVMELDPDWVAHTDLDTEYPEGVSPPKNPLKLLVGSDGLTDWFLDDYDDAIETAQEIAEDHNIAVTRESRPDNGYRFCFDFRGMHFNNN